MKKITFVLVAAFFALSLNLNAQSAVDKIIDKYSGSAGFTSVTMNKYMFEMIGRMDTSEDGEELTNTLSKLESIRILAMDSVSNPGVNLYQLTMKALNGKDYEELMTVQEKGKNVKFLVREKGDIIVELIIVAGGPREDNALIVIKGEIDLASIGSLSKNMHINGLDQLDKLKDRKK